ncbi:tyrosine-type recombinase/integrase [Poseidonibacter ostreae]|uniref:Tyrosine-type recombinase/integrase n=1 Tax=Poseidonibacter ostreae TaxID=2654171 RepID=A0A6L4WV95_9BACT|nr:site-specific integrase [Poseidonibacter ostreae]KAB7889583.1 tyrosine-type recombinase/integrase [Poseidonibacter ostreae]
MSALEKTKFKSVYKRIGKKDTTFYIKYKKLGKSTEKKVGTLKLGMTESKAKKILDEILLNIRKGINEDTVLSSKLDSITVTTRMSLNKLAEIYFDKFQKLSEEEEHLEKEFKLHKDKEGIRREKSLYKSFWLESDLAQVPFHNITTQHFVDRILELEKLTKTQVRNLEQITLAKYSGKYLQNGITLIKSIIKHTKCSHNPLEIKDVKAHEKTEAQEKLEDIYSRLKAKSEPRSSYLEPFQIKRLLDKLKEKDAYHQGYLMTLLIATTGMRPNSVLNLKIKDLMFKDNIIKAFDFKRKMTYYCNLTPLLVLEIQSFIKDRSLDEYLFFSDKTQKVRILPRTPDYLADTINDLFNKKRYGNDRIALYSLRHSFATNLVKGRQNKETKEWEIMPVSIFKIQKLLNHSTIETTIKHYAKFSPDFVMDAISSYEESFI